jgi:hypothetical protein
MNPESRSGIGSAVVVMTLLLTSVLGVMAPAAHAAPSRFVLELCDPAIPGGSPPAMTAFALPTSITPFDTCGQSGGWAGLEQNGSMTGAAQAMVDIPETPGGYVESETMIAEVQHLGPAQDLQRSWVFEEGWPKDGGGESRRSFYIRGEAGAIGNSGNFRIQVGCEVSLITCQPTNRIGARDIAATEVDPNPPTVTSVTGSLSSPGVLRGHQELTGELADVGGGVAKVEVLVNGAQAAPPTSPACSIAKVANASYTGIAAASAMPCPSSFRTGWNLDTATYPFREGSNTVQVCASDFATFGEANRTCSPLHTVTVDNSCTESTVSGGSALSTRFARDKEDEVTVPYGTSARITGELVDQAGDAISGATICVQLATEGSAQDPEAAGTARTDADGHFVYAVPAGPNRSVILGYRHDSFEIANSLHYYAHVRPSINLSSGRIDHGSVLGITGRLPGGPAAAGRVVVLKASARHSRKWYPFGETTTNGDGVYLYHYRFDATTRTTVFRMEAAVPRQDDFPWKAGHSKPALVEVRGRE